MKTICKWALFLVLILAGFTAFAFVVGDENPTQPWTFAEMVGVKVGGIVALCVTVWLALGCYRKGFLPELKQYIDTEE